MDIDSAIKVLEELKKQWNDKYSELLQHVKSYEFHNAPQYIDEFQKKLDSINDDLKARGKAYHQEVDKIADDIIEAHKGNSIIKTLMEGFKSDVDDNWNVYHGNRESRLRDLADIIDKFDKVP